MKNLLKDPELFRTAAFVGGEWIDATPHGNYTVRNPATDELLVELPRFRQDETAQAIEVAHRAFLALAPDHGQAPIGGAAPLVRPDGPARATTWRR